MIHSNMIISFGAAGEMWALPASTDVSVCQPLKIESPEKEQERPSETQDGCLRLWFYVEIVFCQLPPLRRSHQASLLLPLTHSEASHALTVSFHSEEFLKIIFIFFP